MTSSATRRHLVPTTPTPLRSDSFHQYLPTSPTRQSSESYNDYWIATQQSHKALLQQSRSACNDFAINALNTGAYTNQATQPTVNTANLPVYWYQETASAASPDSGLATHQPIWSMYPGQNCNSMGGLSTPTQQHQGLKRARSHQRTPSASTVGSIGPPSPYQYNTAFPQVAGSEYGSNSPATNPWDLSSSNQVSKNISTTSDSQWANESGYLPSQAAHMPAPHLAMKGFAIDHHNLEDMPSDYHHSSRQSSASLGNDSPATPKSSADDADSKPPKSSPTDYRPPNPEVQLQRTESAAYQDELYNPANFLAAATSSAARPANNFLSPHRNLVNERLQTANIARSVSPSSAVSRERSPFRQGSPLAPAMDGWNSTRPGVGTAASLRQQQKEERERAEYAQHQPVLRREATKTISPKDAMLDYNDSEQAPLFQDSVPDGYKQHFGNADPNFQSFFSQDNSAFGGVPTTNQQSMPNFRATSTSADGFAGGNMGTFGNFPPPAMQAQAQIQTPFRSGHYQQVNNMNTSYPSTTLAEPTPDFPAHLTSMESSMSDGQMPSSQEHDNTFSAIQRPTDTRANTGTYTCTYHGCTQRFDSQQNLQRHKRDFHRSQAHTNKDSETSASVSAEGSPRLSASPAPSESGMTSAALLARNSQAGPHKCTRVNPSTGKPCNTVFSRPYDLTRHEDTIHNNRKMKVRCPYCREEKTFSRNDALTRHMRVVHPDVENFGKRGRRAE